MKVERDDDVEMLLDGEKSEGLCGVSAGLTLYSPALKSIDLAYACVSDLFPDSVTSSSGELDACVTELSSVYVHPKTHATLGGMHMLESVKMVLAAVDDAYTMGHIACASVLNPMYAMGVPDVDNVLMLLGVSTAMSNEERSKHVPALMKGFIDCAEKQAGTRVRGGQSVMNPWMLIGGVVTAIFLKDDVIVITKPVGAQVALIAHRWLVDGNPKLKQVLEQFEDAPAIIKKAYDLAILSMCRTNRAAAALIKKYNVHLSTDVSNGGIMAAAAILAQRIKRGAANNNNNNNTSSSIADHEPLTVTIQKIPVIEGCVHVAKICSGINTDEEKIMTSVFDGTISEPSGGLLVTMPRGLAVDFCRELELTAEHRAYIIGKIEAAGHESTRAVLSAEPWVVDGDSNVLFQES